MLAEHLSIDGSLVSIEAEADLSAAVTTTGWALVPAIARAHPFRVSPSGYSRAVEETVRQSFSHVRISDMQEFSLKGGGLRVAQVELPVETGGTRKLTVAGWEGRTGCLSTSVRGWETEKLVEMFDSIQFSERAGGLAIDSPVTPQPREPRVIKEIPELGILSVRPALATVMESIPRSPGAAVTHGELFRLRANRSDLIHVSTSAVTWIRPVEEREEERERADRRTATAASLRVDWRPRRAVR